MKNRKFNEYEVFGNVTKIYVTRRDSSVHAIVIDTKNLEKIKNIGYKCIVQWDEDIQNYYGHITIYLGIVDGKPKYKNITIQDILFPRKKHEKVDHINGDTLDCRESNTRVCLNNQNTKNRKSKNSNNTSGYRNVSWIGGYWRIQLQVDGKNKLFPEKFTDVDEAGKFAEQMRKKHYGEYSGKS